MKNTARKTALTLLLQVDKDGSYSNIALDAALKGSGLEPRDAALATTLFYGVLERRITLDWVLSRHLRQPLKKLKPQVLGILRLGVYQLMYLNKIPDRAVVSEAVNLSKECGCAFASGLINGVLRSVIRTPVDFSEIQEEGRRLSVQYACPEWLVSLWDGAYGREDAAGLLQSSLGRAPLHIRVNTLKTTAPALAERLRQEGVEVQQTGVPNALALTHTGSLETLPSFQQGLFHVQDLASQYCAMALNAQPGQTVADVCAAPGGKSFTAAQWMEDQGTLYALDLHPHRVRLIESGAKRLGIHCLRAETGDAELLNKNIPKCDRVLCDVPCSGLGILRRKPEIRMKSPLDIDNLPELQYRILCTASEYCAVDGLLLYSTCTLNPKENEAVAERFLAANSAFEPQPILLDLPRRGRGPGLTLMTHVHGTDGFYMVLLKRTR